MADPLSEETGRNLLGLLSQVLDTLAPHGAAAGGAVAGGARARDGGSRSVTAGTRTDSNGDGGNK